MTGTLARYFGRRFLTTFLVVTVGLFALIIMLDYIETMRRMSDIPNISASDVARISLFRVPQFGERMLPFLILVTTMSCYLDLSRRLELVVSRAAGLSAWQFIAPAIIISVMVGVIATAAFNPLAALLAERSKRLEAEVSSNSQSGLQQTVNGFWVTQRSELGHSIINASNSSQQGVQLSNVTAFVFDQGEHFTERVEAKTAVLRPGYWQLVEARVYRIGAPPIEQPDYRLDTNLTPAQVRETFSTPETVPFWQLPFFIDAAERAGLTAAGYHLQFQKLLARPFLLAAMVLLAAAFSLRFFRFGGVQKMILGGVASGYLLFVMSKISDDLSKAELLPPAVGAWMPVTVGGLIGLLVLMHLEDG